LSIGRPGQSRQRFVQKVGNVIENLGSTCHLLGYLPGFKGHGFGDFATADGQEVGGNKQPNESERLQFFKHDLAQVGGVLVCAESNLLAPTLTPPQTPIFTQINGPILIVIIVMFVIIHLTFLTNERLSISYLFNSL
jgi:hypothetical protein